jgi:hypothetical protein
MDHDIKTRQLHKFTFTKNQTCSQKCTCCTRQMHTLSGTDSVICMHDVIESDCKNYITNDFECQIYQVQQHYTPKEVA